MKPREKGGVVDPRLNVYGVGNLKVADMSIAPANVACVSFDRSWFDARHTHTLSPHDQNTYSTAITIGEKAALIIAEELGIHGV